jgi:Zn-dependent peptidase ImmA (M78 family)/transcriptional regulator with XRE-family HTH domain
MRTGTPGFVAARLTEGREARGFTQTSLSELTGIKSQSISHYEQGRQSPSPEALSLICEALELPERFFLRPAADFRSVGCFFRQHAAHPRIAAKLARTKAERRLGWLKEITRYAGRFVDLPEVRLPACPVSPGAASEEVERAAICVRAAFGLTPGPLENLTQLLESRGCIVTRWALDADLEGSYSQFDSGVPYMALRSDDVRTSWVRYSAAHELGHLTMHRHLPCAVMEEAEAHRALKAQADRFARAFLLPASAFAGEVWAPTIDALLTLKKEWRCPVSVMVFRCGEVGLFDADQVRRATVNLARRGWKASEPREEIMDREAPQLLARSLRLLLEERLKDRHSLLTDLGLNAWDVEELAGLERGFLATARPEPPAALRLLRSE